MYDELIKDLRENHDKYFARDMQAADAIELLVLQLAFRDETAKLVAQKLPKWIPVTERLPEGDANVLLYYEWTGRSGTIYREVGITSIPEIANDPTEMLRPLYWMPIPEPPESEGER